MIRMDGTVPHACSMPTGLRIRASMVRSVQWYPLRVSDQHFRPRGPRFQSNLGLRRQLLVHHNTLECQCAPPMFLPLWTLMPHVAGMPFRCSADVVENPDTLQGSVRRLMTSVTCLWTRGKTGLSTFSLDLMWQLQKLSPQLRRLRRFRRNGQKVRKRILRPTAGEPYAPAVH